MSGVKKHGGNEMDGSNICGDQTTHLWKTQKCAKMNNVPLKGSPCRILNLKKQL